MTAAIKWKRVGHKTKAEIKNVCHMSKLYMILFNICKKAWISVIKQSAMLMAIE